MNTAPPASTMNTAPPASAKVIWVTGKGYSMHNKNNNSFYHIVGVSAAPEFKRYRILCGHELRQRIVHFLGAMDEGIDKQIPIEKKEGSDLWRVALDYVDKEPPVLKSTQTTENPKQLNFEHTFVNKIVQSQKFTIDSDSVKKLTYLAQKRKTTKDKLLREIVYTYVQALETTEALF